jgi:hypothetical protein
VAAYNFSATTDKIVADGDPNTYVEVISGSEKTVNVVLGSETVAEFGLAGSRIHRIVISDSKIRAMGADDLTLQPGFGGNVSASNSRITNVADPIDLQDVVTLQYAISNFLTVDVLNPDLTNLQDGSVLVYNATTSRFEATTLLIKQEIDAGNY